MSNGYELGDPCCVWTSGSSSWNGKRTTGLTSPGLANSGSDVTTVHSCPGGGGGGAATTTTPTGAQSTAAPPSGGGMGAASVSASTRSGPVFVLWNLLLFTLVVKISDRLY
ncbi:unnamed protein product [Amoebophrya sp. A25]|nr:unnamed protein product [Amoebophrya sp. A25]|eukprot:GSA25T00020983001.1